MSLPKSIVLAKDAKPGQPYRTRGRMVARGLYYEVTPVATVRRLAKKRIKHSMRLDEIRAILDAQKALEGKVVLLTRFIRGTSHEGRYEHRLGYVAVPTDYQLRLLKSKPGYV